MHNSRWSVIWAGFGAVILVYFQNCAPAPGEALTPFNEDGSEVKIIEGWQGDSSGFLTSEYEVSDPSSSMRIDGQCANLNGSNVDWDLVRRVGVNQIELLGSGSTLCVQGSFKVIISQLPLESCQDSIELRASVQGAQIANTKLSAKCSN